MDIGIGIGIDKLQFLEPSNPSTPDDSFLSEDGLHYFISEDSNNYFQQE